MLQVTWKRKRASSTPLCFARFAEALLRCYGCDERFAEALLWRYGFDERFVEALRFGQGMNLEGFSMWWSSS